ncbi:hypothetical protein KUCAC02_031815 [Chaenocephalus aceratus]|nr:hypothetical protein KUCAC02_031815 [Chaenocephalus aceratus]
MLEASLGGNSSHSSFLFGGFPALQNYQRLLVLVLLIGCYVTLLLGNCALLLVIGSVASLHSPMYLLIASLCAVDILVGTTIFPTTLLSLLFNWDRISLSGCLTQMFFTHFLSSLESTLLLAMALDRYVAICLPLRYNKIMNASVFAKLLLFALFRSGSVMGTLLSVRRHGEKSGGRTRRYHLFRGRRHPVIFFSYVKILSVVLRASASGEDRWKAFHTCGTHLMVMTCFYLVGSVSFLSPNINIPPDAHTFMGLMYILLPATVNPIIYGVRTKEIRNGFLKIFKVRAKKLKSMKVKVSPAGKGKT